jgi:predicted ATP-binding protein involved in virulence
MTTMGPTRLQRLELENFRGFEKLALDFEPDLTVLVGANGSGKSTVLDGIVAVARKQNQIAPTDFRSGRERMRIRLLRGDAQGNRWEDRTEARRGPGYDGYAISTSGTGISRLFVYRANRQVRDQTPDAASTSYSKRWSAQDHWDNASASYEDFFHWLKALEDIENEQVRYEGGAPNPQLAAVKRAIVAFLPEFQEIRVRRHMPPFSNKPVLMLRKGNVELPFNALSEGERTTIAMVGDIARRLVLLGEHEDPLQEAATVLIDEIEQHAHPGWQRQILKRFRNTFPNVQLITTTHSPVIVSEVEPRHLRVLKDFALVPPEHGPGRDANAVLEDIFEVPPRKEEVQKAIDDLANAIEDDDFDRADELLARLDELVPGGADPDILYYRNLLARLREP